MTDTPVAKPHGALSEAEADELTTLLVFGLDGDEEIDGRTWKAFEPLTTQAAARFMGIRVKRARIALMTERARVMLRTKVEAIREGERARNIIAAVAIRDNPGEGLAADRTVQLKAIGVIEGQSGKGVNVNVSVNNNTNVATVSPGYVIKLRPSSQALIEQGATPKVGPALEPVTLEHEP